MSPSCEMVSSLAIHLRSSTPSGKIQVKKAQTNENSRENKFSFSSKYNIDSIHLHLKFPQFTWHFAYRHQNVCVCMLPSLQTHTHSKIKNKKPSLIPKKNLPIHPYRISPHIDQLRQTKKHRVTRVDEAMSK